MLYLTRHGLRLNKVYSSYDADFNPPLHISDIGNLCKIGGGLKFDIIFCSPFLRCVQTAHYLNSYDAPICIEYGLSEVLMGEWFDNSIINPLDTLISPLEMKKHYYCIDDSYRSFISSQNFPEKRKESRKRTQLFLNWFRGSEWVNKDVLMVGHGASVKDILFNLGIRASFQGWEGGWPAMGHLFTIDVSNISGVSGVSGVSGGKEFDIRSPVFKVGNKAGKVGNKVGKELATTIDVLGSDRDHLKYLVCG